MPVFPFVGPSYVSRSVNFDAQRSVNVFPIQSEVSGSKRITALEGRPGLRTFLTLPRSPLRGGIRVNDRVFVVGANTLYETFADGTYTARGTLNSQNGNVSLDTNGLQVCIVDGPDGYIFTLLTNTFTEISDPYFLGATTVTFIDGYFAFNKPDSQIYYISTLYDGLTGDPLDFASAEGSPDNLVAVKAVHQQLWLFGENTTQIVTNTGAADFPFQTVQASLIQYGCAAPFSIVQAANIVFWLGRDEQGNCVFWKAEGYSPQRISTHAVEYAVQQYPNIVDSTAYCYQEDGRYFMVWNFPQAISWAFDVEINQWHERAYFSNGSYSRHRPNFHIFAYGKHLVGDYEDGRLYEQRLDIYTDDTQRIRRLRSAQYIADDLEYLYFEQFQLDMQTGVGLEGDGSYGGAFSDGFDDGFQIGDALMPDTDPQLLLSWSNNGGHTFCSEIAAPVGKIGQYGVRAIWRRLGRGRQRVFRVVFSAACKCFWIASHVQLSKGTN